MDDRPPPLDAAAVVPREFFRDVSLETADLAVRLAIPEGADETGGPSTVVVVHELADGEAGAFVANVFRLGHPTMDPLIRVATRTPVCSAGAARPSW